MLEQMVEVYSYQLDVARESQKQVNSLRHDMKHHIIELQSMLKNTNNPEIIKYLQDMEKFMLNPKEYHGTFSRDGLMWNTVSSPSACTHPPLGQPTGAA